MKTRTITITVNGRRTEHEVEPRTGLGDHLRDRLGLTGTHLACETGECGSCTVLLDGEPVRSCLMLAVQADGRQVDTAEGNAGVPAVERFIAAAVAQNGFQCGYCASGVAVAVRYYSSRADTVTADDVLAGHLCRCTGYVKLRRAVDEALAARS